jgi:hypothetical protein
MSDTLVQNFVIAMMVILLLLSIFVLKGESMEWYNIVVNGLIPFGDIFTRTQFLGGSMNELFTLFPIFQLPVYG